MTFGPSALLDPVSALCFYGCGLVDFEIPASVRAICVGLVGVVESTLTGGIMCGDGCCFCSYGLLQSLSVPDNARELDEGCFRGRQSLPRVTFGPSRNSCWPTFRPLQSQRSF